MTVLTRIGKPVTRRQVLMDGASAAATITTGALARPYLSRTPDRPVITHGIQSGDVSVDAGVVWARADRPARMLVEVSTTDSFRTIRGSHFVDALPEADCTAKLLLEDLPPRHRLADARRNGHPASTTNHGGSCRCRLTADRHPCEDLMTRMPRARNNIRRRA